MIELGLFYTGQTDLPLHRVEGGLVVPTGTLEDMHESAQRTIAHQVRQGVLAEEVGFEVLFLAEHHFHPEGYEVSPNPILVQTAVAAQTERLLLSQYANIITWWHPLRLAEQAATLDVISGGRLEFGIGRGYQSRETEVFGRNFGATIQDQERNRVAFDEAWEIIRRAWTEPSFSHHGENFSLPPSYTKWHHPQTMALFGQEGYGPPLERVMAVGKPNPKSSLGPVIGGGTLLKEISVFPQPLQKPYPQVSVPLTSERSIRWAAANGANGGFLTEPIHLLKKNVAIYYDEAEKQGWPDRLDRGAFKYGWDAERRRGIQVMKACHITDEPDDPQLRERLNLGVQLGMHFYGGFGFLGLLAKEGGEVVEPDFSQDLDWCEEREWIFIGPPEVVAEKILRIREEVGFEDFRFGAWLEMAGFSAEEVEHQIRRFGEEVAPILRRELGSAADVGVVAGSGGSA